MDMPPADTPIVCDLTGAPDTGPQRLAEYQRLFTSALVGRERTGDGVRFRFRADPGVEEWVRDLAAREKACCGFFAFRITRQDTQVCWDAAVADNDSARAILEEFYALPDTAGAGAELLEDRVTRLGLRFTRSPEGASGQPSVGTPGQVGGVVDGELALAQLTTS